MPGRNIIQITPKRILFTARHPAAVDALSNVAFRLISDGLAESSRFLCGEGVIDRARSRLLPIIDRIEVISVPQTLNCKLEYILEETLSCFSPEVLIAGASSLDVGIDEAAIRVFADNGLGRSYVVQDFWGDVNLGLSKPADTYLVLDEVARDHTLAKIDADVFVVGPVRYASVTTGADSRRTIRQEPRDSRNIRNVCFAGMPDWIGGVVYMDCLVALSSAVRALGDVRLTYRPHPLETKSQVGAAQSLLSRLLGGITVSSDDSPEDLAHSYDLVVSPYSSCLYDTLMLRYQYGWESGANVVYWLPTEEMYEAFVNHTGLERPPISQMGLAKVVYPGSDPKKVLLDAISSRFHSQVWKGLGSLPSPNESLDLVVKRLIEDGIFD